MPRDAELAADHPRHLCRGDRARGADAASAGATCRHDNSTLGESVKPTEPAHHAGVHRPRQEEALRERVRAPALHPAQVDLERDLQAAASGARRGYYPVSISCRTVIYKGMFLADQLGTYYPDLHDPDFESALALVHQRFSTNTFPTWSLAHPYRYIAHNGEINTLRGNVNWMAARQASRVLAAVRQGHQQAVADLLRRPVRHRLLRQRARIPDARRLLARPRHDDDDPRGLGGQSADGRGAARLLRIQRRADGAVGRPGRDRLHQRPPDRRHARPQRLAAGALSAHPRRPHRHGVGNGRAADPGKGHRQEVAAAAGQDAAGRSRRGPAHSRRGIEGDAGQEPSLQGMARPTPRSCWKTCPAPPTRRRSRTCRCSIASRRSATPRKT